jgi:ribosomal protein S18 acetylase RimI-like enzyme
MHTPSPVTFTDLLALWRLERACFGTEAWGLIELGYSLLAASVRLKITEGTHPIGFVIGERNWWGKDGLITILGVHPQYQRRGLGRQLLHAAEAQLNTRCYKLTVRVSNTAAIALYEQCSYQRIGRVSRYYRYGEDGWVMEKTASANTLP